MRLLYEIKAKLEALGRQRWVSVLGVAVAVLSAAATQAEQIKPAYGVVIMFASTLAAALGKALKDSAGNKYLTYAAIAFAVAYSLTAYADLFPPGFIAWAGVAVTALAAFGRAVFGVDFNKGDLPDEKD